MTGVQTCALPIYTNELEMLISEKTLSFRMGFTPIDSDRTFWSDDVQLNVITLDK